MSRGTKNLVQQAADKQRRVSEEVQTSGGFDAFVKLLEKAQRALFEVLLFVLFATMVYRFIDHELHLTEKFYDLAAMILTYLGR